ncbi:hypothetical protein BN14_05614 [Rhizoctonia solani AG-1 IB]|uniref:Uncharacterized protein n=1 Tax=Thanatephorus cucumeris (strain AG1-IB / isolate 7/3/14) TaxID=1108050 RepID=M5BWE5_THACB|nr:hypothetical protein BN14_05614 [Rhizoctonia solani AG-1 IB]
MAPSGALVIVPSTPVSGLAPFGAVLWCPARSRRFRPAHTSLVRNLRYGIRPLMSGALCTSSITTPRLFDLTFLVLVRGYQYIRAFALVFYLFDRNWRCTPGPEWPCARCLARVGEYVVLIDLVD